jgi:DNA-binding transcriptional LysR family regulator
VGQARVRRYLRHGTLPQLAAFEAVVRLGSCAKAAEELCVSQPCISVHLRKLAETVGLPLFEHAGRRLVPTAAGRELLVAARALYATLGAMDERLEPIRAANEAAARRDAETAKGRAAGEQAELQRFLAECADLIEKGMPVRLASSG